MDAEKGTGKTDVGYTLRIDEPPSTQLRDWLDSDLFIELHCSQPRFEFKILEENQEPLKDVVIDEADGLPKIEQKVIGVSFIEVETKYGFLDCEKSIILLFQFRCYMLVLSIKNPIVCFFYLSLLHLW